VRERFDERKDRDVDDGSRLKQHPRLGRQPPSHRHAQRVKDPLRGARLLLFM